ncbi:hypothetical protein M8J76_015919 [Diaphorina citri]|nr:hypothetical protein M8J75_010790 [Diaphorina citri]KAI5714363.1 hypothetical protein M8J76_015919 [Diaphorina citri]KAI5714624.1 hypothetical protein M8J77_002809 [Diaphorina citri]
MIFSRGHLFFCIFVLTNFPNSLQELTVKEDYILCKSCGAEVSSALKIIDIKSPFSENYHTESLFGVDVPVQELTNPYGIKFSVVIVRSTLCVAEFGPWYSADSWFPGYAWKLCRCSKCNSHVGWVFEPIDTERETTTLERVTASDQGFNALILSKVISEFYSDSLIQT